MEVGESSSSLVRLPDALPALPSSTKGPASFLGVMGQSVARSAVKVEEALANMGDSPARSTPFMVTDCVTEEECDGDKPRSGGVIGVSSIL